MKKTTIFFLFPAAVGEAVTVSLLFAAGEVACLPALAAQTFMKIFYHQSAFSG